MERIVVSSNLSTGIFIFLYFFASCYANVDGNDCTRDNNVCKLPDQHSLRFFILGDWGGQERYPYVTYVQNLTARSLYNSSADLRPHFYVSTGDNFYERGVKSVKDERFEKAFDNVYLYGKKEHVPWYITSGNHDYYGSVQAQLDYTKLNPRWVYPSLSYSVRYSFRNRGGRNHPTTVTIFFIDTIVLCGGTSLGGWNPKTRTFVRPSDVPKGPKNVTAANELVSWLTKGLKQTKSDFLFIVGHYPIYSTGIHGDTECLRDLLPDMLTKYQVNAYISGHEHQLQHSLFTGKNKWTVNHVISGAGSKFDKRPNRSDQQRRAHFKAEQQTIFEAKFSFPTMATKRPLGGYVYAEVFDKFASFDYYNSNGNHLYSFLSQRRNAE